MRIKFNKNLICSLLLTSSIALSATSCTREIKEKRETAAISTPTVEETIETNENIYLNINNMPIDLNILNNTNYKSIGEDNKYTLFEGANIYFKDGLKITNETINDTLKIVTAIESNEEFTLIELSTGERAYVNTNYLIKCPNLNTSNYINLDTNNDTYLINGTYLYDNYGMYIGYLESNQPCKAVATNGEYTFINLPDGKTGYVLDMSLMNNLQQINGYAFIKAGANLYTDKNLTNIYRTSNDEVVQVQYVNYRYAAIFEENGHDILYVNPNVLADDFIIVDLNGQHMNCYLDYQVAGSWGTRSGKDSTPTHTGAFDIDWKVENWEFTTYPGSHAKYWIPINEYAEGIHDLVGDDEQNYGNEAYHAYGSHGCIRVPAAASEFVYNNYEVGDMVLVRKK